MDDDDRAHGAFAGYQPLGGPDEMWDGEVVRPAYRDLYAALRLWDPAEYERRQQRADLALFNAGITFTVYADEQGTERIFPFSLIPRVVEAQEWARIDRGLRQRVRALNLFLADIYHDGRALTDGVVPREVVEGSPAYRPEMRGLLPPRGVYAHVAGCDLVRDGDGQFVVLEDNLRTPSGVSYVLENRAVMRRVVPDLFPAGGVVPVGDYPDRLRAALVDVAPAETDGDPNVVVLTPGIYNAAYFEHAFLSQQMGVPLVEGSDLVVDDRDRVFLRSTTGLERVDVIYRRIDDDFLDPEVFRPESVLGVPGLMRAYRAGNVTLANAVGAGVADDKVLYRFVPQLVRYYLGEDPVLPNIPTYAGVLPEDLAFIEAHAAELVLKPANASGGYGVVIVTSAEE